MVTGMHITIRMIQILCSFLKSNALLSFFLNLVSTVDSSCSSISFKETLEESTRISFWRNNKALLSNNLRLTAMM